MRLKRSRTKQDLTLQHQRIDEQNHLNYIAFFKTILGGLQDQFGQPQMSYRHQDIRVRW